MVATINMQRLFSLATCLSFAFLAPSTAWAADAPVVTDNPQGVQYIADFTSNGIIAQIVASTPPDGQGVAFTININGNVILNSANYLYHIHEEPVPEDGNCTLTEGHLDPYDRGETPACDSNDPASCQVGDLSGKHGTIPSLPGFNASYTDDYFSLTPDTPAFMGNRSFVLHYPNLTRIACGNFELVEQPCIHSNSTVVSVSSNILAATSTVVNPLPAGPTFTTSPSVSTVPLAGSAKKTVVQSHAVVLGPLLLGIAAAVW